MPKTYTQVDIQYYLQTLRETPRRMLACAEGLDNAQLSTAPTPDSWSMVEHMAHVRGSSEIWSNSIDAMLTQDKPQLVYIHPRTWIKNQRYTKLSFAENYQAFKTQRDGLLPTLEMLSFEDWGRSATFIGKVNTYTVFGEVLRMAGHELVHCQQLEMMGLAR